jgi:hypothetical protein
MIWHFFKTDLKTFKLYWVILFAITALSFIFKDTSKQVSNMTGYAYIIFALMPLHHLAGVTFRSQHIMSRNYLLSLPMSRNKLFLLTLFRASIFWLPLFGFLFYMSFNSHFFKYLVFLYQDSRIIYGLIVIMAIFWSIASSMNLQLNSEKITTYLTQHQRLRAWTLFVLFFVGEIIIVVYSLISPRLWVNMPWLPMIILAALMINKIILIRKKWLFQ